MCTVLLRLAPGAPWPLLLAAVRDEFTDRAWDPPAAHWPDRPTLVGGRDRVAGGTWLAVAPDRPAVAAVLNGVRRPPPAGRDRPSRGQLPLAVLAGTAELDERALTDYDGFHLLHGTADGVRVWSWDGAGLTRVELTTGDHIIVNEGVDADLDPLVPHFAALLAATASPSVGPAGRTPGDAAAGTATAWAGWVDLLRGDGLPADDPRALIVRHEFGGRVYGSTSASLVAVAAGRVRFDFTADPGRPAWAQVALPAARG